MKHHIHSSATSTAAHRPPLAYTTGAQPATLVPPAGIPGARRSCSARVPLVHGPLASRIKLRAALPRLCAAACASLLFAGCSSTKVQTGYQDSAQLPRPDQVFVYNLAVSPEEVELGTGLAADIENLAKKTPRTDQEKAIGNAVANVLSKKLVADIQATGFATSCASGPPPDKGSTLALKGQFVSIDEGNSTEREVIGLGLGRTKVKAKVQLYVYRAGQPPLLVASYEADAEAGRKPGMAESMGVGGLTGHLAASAAIGVGGAVVSEEFTGTVDADITRMAKAITDKLKTYCATQGWIVQY